MKNSSYNCKAIHKGNLCITSNWHALDTIRIFFLPTLKLLLCILDISLCMNTLPHLSDNLYPQPDLNNGIKKY